MGFWFPQSDEGFYAQVPSNIPPNLIFYPEALCVVSAIDMMSRFTSKQRLLIYTDNQNTVDIFSTLRCLPDYNAFLIYAVDRIAPSAQDFRVLHVSGADNIVADAISRYEIGRALDFRPGLNIRFFTPPNISIKS
ncbi:hypothetical protein DFP72DRAFT_833021 [Ephemerocybe angulata]|uniref:Uncharacterized protein n=1 Tax=Ephemerocybe angulata TaxID=980116 RepID=A0A8H6H6U3_9AGAR|nr:hypothetical protein DFP72DRAFT_833021 [Tulosesus angulatus]